MISAKVSAVLNLIIDLMFSITEVVTTNTHMYTHNTALKHKKCGILNESYRQKLIQVYRNMRSTLRVARNTLDARCHVLSESRSGSQFALSCRGANQTLVSYGLKLLDPL